MTQQHRVGVVTVTYNSGKVIDEFLKSLLAQTHADFILYAVDNASSDDTLTRLQSFSDSRVVVVPNQQNLGFAAGTNVGIHAALEAACQSVLVINNDTAFGPQLIEKLVSGLSEHGCQMTVPKILFYDHPDKIWAAGGTLSWWRGLRPKHFGRRQTDRGQFDKPRRISFAPLCCALIAPDVFRLIGCLDTRYFVYFEDADFMERAERADLKVVYVPSATVQHRVGALTGGDRSNFTIRNVTQSYFYFLLKRFGIWRSLPLLIANHAYFAARLLVRIDTLSVYRLRQASFRDAIQMYRQISVAESVTHGPVNCG
jgi:GT2 family glycosyltransferase